MASCFVTAETRMPTMPNMPQQYEQAGMHQSEDMAKLKVYVWGHKCSISELILLCIFNMLLLHLVCSDDMLSSNF